MTVKTPEEYRSEKVLIDFKPGSEAGSRTISFSGFSMNFEPGRGPFEIERRYLKRLKKLGFVEAEKKPFRSYRKKEEESEILRMGEKEDGS